MSRKVRYESLFGGGVIIEMSRVFTQWYSYRSEFSSMPGRCQVKLDPRTPPLTIAY